MIVDRLGVLFGVSILEDKGHAHTELWDIVYQMSIVISEEVGQQAAKHHGY
jgi:hypothetical protein